MQELLVLGSWGPFTVTAYGLCVLAGALAAVAVTLLRSRKSIGTSRGLSLCLAAIISAWLGGRIVYVLVKLEEILVDTEFYGVPFILHPWEGGYTLYGAVLGCMAGVALYAKCTHQKAGKLFDTLVPGAALALCCIRLGEYFISQGLGHYVEEEALQVFPFAVLSMDENWQQPVFLWEAAAALVIGIVLLVQRKPRREGALGEQFLTLLGATQIFLESHREDECIRFGFVRFSQVAAIVVIAAVFFKRIRARVKAHGWRAGETVRVLIFLLAVVLCILIEFALDKSSIDNHLLYAIMFLALTALSAAVLKE